MYRVFPNQGYADLPRPPPSVLIWFLLMMRNEKKRKSKFFPTFKKKIRLKIVWNVYPNLFWILTTKKIGKKIHDQKNWKKNSNIKNNFFITYFFVLKSSETYARKNLVIGSFWGWGSADRYLRITPTFSYKFKRFWKKKKMLGKKKFAQKYLNI